MGFCVSASLRTGQARLDSELLGTLCDSFTSFLVADRRTERPESMDCISWVTLSWKTCQNVQDNDDHKPLPTLWIQCQIYQTLVRLLSCLCPNRHGARAKHQNWWHSLSKRILTVTGLRMTKPRRLDVLVSTSGWVLVFAGHEE